jgi:hypothetical protein
VNPRLANKMTNGKQRTTLWHIDALKTSHVNHKVLSSVTQQLDEEFGKEALPIKMRGKVHDHL